MATASKKDTYNVEQHAQKLHETWVATTLAIPGSDQRDQRLCVWDSLNKELKQAFYNEAQRRYDAGLVVAV